MFNIYVDFCFYIDKKYEKVRKVCDSKTLVGLARTLEVDDRFFDPFPAPDKYEVRYISFIFISELLHFLCVCTSESIVLEGAILILI